MMRPDVPAAPTPSTAADRRLRAHHGRATLFAMLVGALVAAGCASPGPRVQHAALRAAAPATAASTSADANWPTQDWWRQWGDPGVAGLVDEALAGQPGLRVAQARLQQAQARIDAVRADERPQVQASAVAQDQRFTANGLYPPPLGGTLNWTADAQIGLSWELDLFGRRRAELVSAIGQARASEAETQAARELLATNVVTAYVTLADQLEARRIAERGLAQRREVLALVQQRSLAGLDTALGVRQAQGLIAQTRVELEALDDAIARSRRALAELCGRTPDAFATLAPDLAQLKGGPVPNTLPLELLGRRADLVALRWRVESALQDVEVARTQFYPNVNLAAFVGLSSIGLDRFAEAGSRTYGAGPAIHLPLFDGPRLRANLRSRDAGVDAAIETYNASLLRALREVADALGSLRSVDRQASAQGEALGAAEGAFGLAMQRYQAGLGNFLEVLTAEGNVLVQRRAWAALQGRRLTTELALTHALGGGYQIDTASLAALSAPTAAAGPATAR